MLPFYAYLLLLLPIYHTNGKFYLKSFINSMVNGYALHLTWQSEFDVFKTSLEYYDLEPHDDIYIIPLSFGQRKYQNYSEES